MMENSKKAKRAIGYTLLIGAIWLFADFETSVIWGLCINIYETIRAGEEDEE